MNDLDYLNQISQGVSKPAAQSGGFLDKKMKIVLGVLGGVIVFFIIVMAALGSSSTQEKTDLTEIGRLNWRSNELIKVINTYNGALNHSSLRSSGASLSTLLTEISATTQKYLQDSATEDEAATTATPTSSDTQIIQNLNTSLTKAKLNGLLDRTYANEMYYQIRWLIALEESVTKKSNDEVLKKYLGSSTESLTRLQDAFYKFSE